VHEHDGEPLTKAWLLMEEPRFEKLVNIIIALNTILLVADFFIDGHEAAFEVLDYSILAFFCAELFIKLAAVRWRVRVFLNKRWNVFDTVVITLSLLPFLGSGVLLFRMARLARVLHSARHIKHVRMVRFFGKW
jgi:hypothetical protein